MTQFRPCIDLHAGQVKQIVGGTLRDEGAGPRENFVASQPAEWFAARYRDDQLAGGHVIQLGPGNVEAARAALAAYPGGLQLGGGVTPENARSWLDAGASQIIVTSYLFDGPQFAPERLARLLDVVKPSELVIDLSCRRVGDGWRVATNRWQTVTEVEVDRRLLEQLAPSCAEFLIHAADVEGLCQGIDEELVQLLGRDSPLPSVYAGGARDISDLARVSELSGGRVHLTYGSALDLFGGKLVRYADCVAWNRAGGS
ncbi:MAG TPA: phosphoribosylformimino-5-aminoimidazole carboxamide ribotide isomerase [Polyangiaceae bacterium]|nr:phosphoribosylformimino-5-aminoimidazole carboxamide ribotide isomerase [Polyangiaceae bacterium]